MFASPTERDMLTGVAGDLPTSDQPMAHHPRPGMEQHRALDQGVIQVEERGAAHARERTASPIAKCFARTARSPSARNGFPVAARRLSRRLVLPRVSHCELRDL